MRHLAASVRRGISDGFDTGNRGWRGEYGNQDCVGLLVLAALRVRAERSLEAASDAASSAPGRMPWPNSRGRLSLNTTGGEMFCRRLLERLPGRKS